MYKNSVLLITIIITIVLVISLVPFHMVRKESNLAYAQYPTTLEGMAIGNINGDPRLDIVLLTRQHLRLDNIGYYRIGYDISETNSTILHGWTQPIEIAGYFPTTSNIHAMAIGNINEDPRPDMVISYLTEGNPHYRIGYDISETNSTILHGWTQPIEIVPFDSDPYTFVNGIAIGNINEDPRLDIVVLSTKHSETNESPDPACYRIGYDISETNSTILHGVTQPIPVLGSCGPSDHRIIERIALGNINKDPRLDMVLLGEIQSTPYHLRYYYRIGYDISESDSTILHGVTQPIEISDADPVASSTSHIALGNINKDPRLDMVLVGESSLNSTDYYRIGYDISETNSTISHGVTQPIEIPADRIE